LHFSVGAALCNAALGINSPERFSKWEVKEQDLIPNEKDLVQWLLDEILTKYVVHRIPAARQVCFDIFFFFFVANLFTTFVLSF